MGDAKLRRWWHRWPGSLLVALAACSSTPGPADDTCQFAQISEPFTLKCLDHSLDPVTDPANPDFGRIPCFIVEFAPQGSDLCGCQISGYRPATQEQIATALSLLGSDGECRNACCESLCFCELLQLSGDDLQTCQAGNAAPIVNTPGFCYVEPDLGIGDPSTVSGCGPNGARARILFTPPHWTHQGVLACEGTVSD